MEWEKAKTYILIFFVILNVGLGSLMLIENRRYTLTAEQERHIRTVLNQNNISMYTLMHRFPPMRHLDVTGFYYDTDEIISMLFETPDATQRQGDNYIFEDDINRLTISNGFIFFESPQGFRNSNEINPRQVAAGFIRENFPDYVLDSEFVEPEGGVRLIFREMYRGHLVHSNQVEFYITDGGIVQIEMQFGRILGHSGELRMLASPDEALLTFVQRVRHFTQDTPMTIVGMDLVYFQEYLSDQEGGVYHAVPFYRVFTRCSGDRPYLINAFFNVIID